MSGSVRLSQRSSHLMSVARACAALYVVIHHVALARDFSFPFSIFKHFGHQAVIAFFLMSGFLIHANERHRVLREPMRYALRRGARVYPALIVALAISIFIVSGKWSYSDLFGNLFALQDTIATTPGTLVGTFKGNSPLWSLSYELWFYLLYPFVMLISVRNSKVAHIVVGAACVLSYVIYIIYPNHFLVMTTYFASWWAGAAVAEAYGSGKRDVRSILLPLLALAATCVIATLPMLWKHGPQSEYPALQANHLWSALLFTAAVFSPLGVYLAKFAKAIPVRVATTLASISYGLYVFHWPILVQWRVAQNDAGFTLAVVVLLAVSWLCDRELSYLIAPFIKKRDVGLMKSEAVAGEHPQ